MEYEKKHMEQLRGISGECTLFLKRKGNVFPLDHPVRTALYGHGARHTVRGGMGSGEVNSHFEVSIEQGLKDAGFEVVTEKWLNEYDRVMVQAKQDFYHEIRRRAKETKQNAIIVGMGAVMPEPEYSIPIQEDADIALYILSRTSGEGGDRNIIPGDFLLTSSEIRDICYLQKKYGDSFMLVLNVSGPVDLSPVNDAANILLLGQLGVNTAAVLADLLLGSTYPSGKLTQTWAKWEDYCHVGEECEQDDTHYREGIYVGYRYFDSVGKEPLYPFGYGMGYTEFTVRTKTVTAEGRYVKVTASVTNTGSHPGREVVQVYLSAPSGTIDRPYQELAGYRKTSELRPGESEDTVVCFDLADMACYDTEHACWKLTAGDYIARTGNSSRHTEETAVIRLEQDIITRRCRNVFKDPGFQDWKPEMQIQHTWSSELPVIVIGTEAFLTQDTMYDTEPPVEEVIRQRTDEDLIQLGVGAFKKNAGLAGIIGTASFSVPGAAGETGSLLSDQGIGRLVMADGPAGLRLSRDYYRDEKGIHVLESTIPESIAAFLPKIVRWFIGRKPKIRNGTEIRHQYATHIPSGNAIAQSWNPELAQICGNVVGSEMNLFGVHLWLAPALNILRHVRCGRNFEYYSEDPVLSGTIASGITEGVQEIPGCGVTIKHICANNQEQNRYNSNSAVSERALREIYLKGFGICIRRSAPAAAMTSYNLVNGVHTSEHRGLIEDILRSEFGFDGIVMTDWITGGSVLSKNARYPVPHAGKVAAAGSELFMPGSNKEIKEMKTALKSGVLTRRQLEINASRLVRTIQKLQK